MQVCMFTIEVNMNEKVVGSLYIVHMGTARTNICTKGVIYYEKNTTATIKSGENYN